MGRWDTNKGGMYYAVGVGSNLAGRGGDLVIIDDPHSEQTAMSNSGFDDAWDWYTGGPRQRLQPGGSIVLVQTRWSEKDMTGQLLKAMAKDPLADQWEVVELPAIFDDGTPCWPEFWSLDDLTAVRASIPPSPSGTRSISKILRVKRTRSLSVSGGGLGSGKRSLN